MAHTTENEAKITLKLIVNKEENRVIFAEADIHFIDILFSFMTLPMATIARLLEKNCNEKLGSVTNLYQSLIDFPDNYMPSEESKFLMLNPKTSPYDHCRKLKIKIDDAKPTKYFICQDLDCSRGTSALYSTCEFTKCSHCGKLLNREIRHQHLTTYNALGHCGCVDNTGFVHDLTTYIVADDLRVMPNSSTFVIELICEHGIDDISQLDEITIDIGFEQIIILLKSALLYKCPLTCLLFASLNLVRDLEDLRKLDLVRSASSSKEMRTIENKLTLKLLMQKSTSKLLFAEADSDFVDFIFGFLEISLGTLIGKLMNSTSGLETMDNLFSSINNKSVGGCIKSQELKDMILQPQLELKYLSENQMFPLKVVNGSQIYCYSYVNRSHNWEYMTHVLQKSDRSNKCCPLSLKDPRIEGKCLKPSLKFMVTDDLVITPLSSTLTLAMLSKLKVPLNDVEEHEVCIGIEEGLKILKSSLISFSTLSNALLTK